MKKQRTIPFGYMIKKGVKTVKPSEARFIPEIFKMYLQGNSIGGIAKSMNENGMPYSEPNPTWDKHKIKRILENRAYIGENGYPAIISQKLFANVRERYDQKPVVKPSSECSGEKRLWKKTYCAECGSRMPRAGIYSKSSGRIVLTCQNPKCGSRIDVLKCDFIEAVTTQMQENYITHNSYHEGTPSQTELRLNAEINRLIEKPTDEKAIQMLILKAAAERYARCPDENESKNADHETIDWQLFKEQVDRVEISRDGRITLTGK